MAETRNIQTLTISTSLEDSLEICSIYLFQDVTCNGETQHTDLPRIKKVILAEQVGSLNGESFIEGELAILAVEVPTEVDFWLNNNGELIITGEDANGYYIDDDGNLIYDYCVTDCLDGYVDCGYYEDNYVNE